MKTALQELSDLSLALQNNSITLPEAHTFVCRTIKVFNALAERRNSEDMHAVQKAEEEMEFKGVSLHQKI